MTQHEPMVVAGLTFTPVPMPDYKAFADEYERVHNIKYGRVICLIQDKATGRYETKRSLRLKSLLHLVATGKVSVLLQRKYPDHVIQNINVWVAKSVDDIHDHNVSVALYGQWVDEHKENSRAKVWANRLLRKTPDEIKAFKDQFPTLFKIACTFKPLEQCLPKE